MKPEDTVGVGVIGTGGIARLHIEAYLKNPNTRLRALCDINPAACERWMKELGLPDVEVYTDYQSLLARDDIGIVSICTWNSCHAEHSIAALEAGKHVLTEKPLVMTLGECEDLVAAVRRTGLKLAAGQEVRFAPLMRSLKKMVDQGDFGEVFFCESDYLDWKFEAMKKPWHRDAGLVGPWFMHAGCHSVDLLRWLVGDIAEVSAYSNHKVEELGCPTDDCVVAILKFENGCVGRFNVSVGRKAPYDITVALYGTKGTFDKSRGLYLDRFPGLEDFMSFPVSTRGYHCIKEEVDHFVECVIHDTEPLVDIYEGVKTVSTCLAIKESLDRGGPARVRNQF